MLESSFIHFPRIGPVGETRLWQRGFQSWQDIRDRGESDRIASRARVEAARSSVELARRNAGYFATALPSCERWRMYADFLPEAAFIDIETDGLPPGEGVITLIGVLDAGGYTAYVRGENLDEFPEAASRYRLIVTFNGAAFDVPYMRHEFAARGTAGEGLFADAGHLDLRFPLKRIGEGGGLKSVERRLGVGRPDELSSLDGFDAVRLWRMHCEGEPAAMATLVRYNAEDVASLPKLAAYAVSKLSAGTPLAGGSVPPFPDIDRPTLPFDGPLVEYLTMGRVKWQTSSSLSGLS